MEYSNSWFRRRHYLHFDLPVGKEKAEKIVTNPDAVSSHSFFPFISFCVESEKIKKNPSTKTVSKIPKSRHISYGAHLDSHIYSYYSKLLSECLETALKTNGLDKSVLAFRSLGKSNIDFAADAFDHIKSVGACSAIALDISGFFDNLDHKHLKHKWSQILGMSALPKDHYQVFKSLTKYSTVEKDVLHELLGISLNNPKCGARKKLCSPQTFRKKIRSASLIRTNNKNYGIPQGTPVSAVLSNIYMSDFDLEVNAFVRKSNGRYFRYCDDMLFIVPASEVKSTKDFVTCYIKKIKLEINPSKTEIRDFVPTETGIKSEKPLQYLGFTFDGDQVLIRSSALARYSEKMKRGVNFAKATMRKRNRLRRQRGEVEKPLFKMEIYKRYSHLGRRNFIRYGLRAAETFNSSAIKKQIKPLWNRLIDEIDKG